MSPGGADLTLADVARLEEIVSRDALGEVCRSLFDLFSLPVRVLSRDGVLLAEAPGELDGGRSIEDIEPPEEATVHTCSSGQAYRVVPIDYHGRRLGHYIVGPYLPAELDDPRPEVGSGPRRPRQPPRLRKDMVERVTAHLSRVLDLILFSGHRAFLTSEMHVTSVHESYRELAEKTAKLQKAYDDLKELDRLKSNFLATVSHELRTPLTSILGYADMLATGIAGELNEEQREFVQTIRNKGDHLLELITRLLDMNKLERGPVALERVPIDAAALIREVQADLAPRAAKKRVSIDVVIEKPLPTVRADSLRIRQVLLNLVDNAVKFSPPNTRVTIAARAADEETSGDDALGLVLMAPLRRTLEIAVSDEGPGIPPAERERIFDAFYQIDGSSTREHGGTGLGLSIVERLVHAHGGKVSVESTPGRGSTFRFTVPDPDLEP